MSGTKNLGRSSQLHTQFGIYGKINIKLSQFKSIPFLFWALILSIICHAILASYKITSTGREPLPPVNGQQLVLKLHSNEATISPQSHKVEIKKQAQSTNLTSVKNEPSPPSPIAMPERYYEAKELDTLPTPIGAIEPKYPSVAQDAEVHGEVHLAIFIDEHGAVSSLQILQSTHPSLFDRQVMDAFQNAIFTPGIKNSIPVKSRIHIVIRFEQENLKK